MVMYQQRDSDLKLGQIPFPRSEFDGSGHRIRVSIASQYVAPSSIDANK